MMDKKTWINFVESDVVNFLEENELEKLTVEDGRGNKAKIKKFRDGSIKVEYTYKTII